ncbi:hemerythrin domain-containing protein [Micromonospora sp. NPDC048835]|uniref:hemerythrin domain-containing protein n=1 Tax=Micromonospora sp. NPDC048835 TaxID=3155147 RepID=UPI003411661E
MTPENEPFADARDMFAVHTMLRRELGAAPALVRKVGAGDQRRAEVVARHVDLMSQLLEQHHSGEDKHIWPRLEARVPEAIAPIIDVMEKQHEAIHRGAERVNEALRQWRADSSAVSRDALADAVDALLPVLREHLALEEERVVPLIERYITAAEYRLVAGEGGEETSPELLPVIFGMLMYEGAPEVIDSIIAEMPPQAQTGIRELASQAYASYAEKVHGTSTPTRTTGG